MEIKIAFFPIVMYTTGQMVWSLTLTNAAFIWSKCNTNSNVVKNLYNLK